ncbi:hypothetical protein D3C72_1557330 [compost metagenome]
MRYAVGRYLQPGQPAQVGQQGMVDGGIAVGIDGKVRQRGGAADAQEGAGMQFAREAVAQGVVHVRVWHRWSTFSTSMPEHRWLRKMRKIDLLLQFF